MYYFSNSTDMSFDDAVASTREALKRHQFAILAEIDLGKVLRRQLAVDFRPYVIISACSPQLVPQAIEADSGIGSILLCNVVVQQHRDGRVEISVADPAATIGTINNIELISVARKLRFLIQQVIDSISPARVPTALVPPPRGQSPVSTRVGTTVGQNAQHRNDLPAAWVSATTRPAKATSRRSASR
jgi:uncharacterized protein (DUF302 family)